MGACASRAWSALKTHGHVLVVLACAVLALFGVFFIAGGGYLAATQQTPTELGAGVVAGVVGAVMILDAVLGAGALRSGRASALAVFTGFTLALFLTKLVLIVYLLSLVQRVQTVSSPALYAANVTDSTTRAVSDFVYSTYTACCTGCPASICGRALNATKFCDQTGATPRCQWVYPCSAPAGAGAKACFYAQNARQESPPWDIGPSVCGLLQQAAWGAVNKPVVGDIGVDRGVVSCGGGDPKVYALSMWDWLNQQYAWVSAIVGIVLFVELVASISAWALTRRVIETRTSPREKDQLRPFV